MLYVDKCKENNTLSVFFPNENEIGIQRKLLYLALSGQILVKDCEIIWKY